MKTHFRLIPGVLFFVLLAGCSKKDHGPDKPQETIIYQTDFSKDDGKWYVGSTSTGFTGKIQDGYYQLSKTSDGSYYVSTNPLFSNVTGSTAIEASLSVSDIDPNASYLYSGGLAWNCNLNNNNTVFYFGIFTAGEFVVQGWPDGNNLVTYKSITKSSAVKTNDFNTLRIELRSGQLHFLINGTEVYSMTPANSSNTLDRAGFNVGYNESMRVRYFKATSF